MSIEPVVLPPEMVVTLAQVRKTYDEIEDLAVSMLLHGQQSPGRIAPQTEEGAREYLRVFNAVFGSAHALEDFSPVWLKRTPRSRAEPFYLFLVYGHRRLRAAKEAIAMVNEGLAVPGDLWVPGYRAELHFGMTPREAIDAQFAENRHKAVPLLEEVEAAQRYLCFRRMEDPSYGPRQLAGDIGRSDSWVADAMRFTALPESLQQLVIDPEHPAYGRVQYGHLVQVARLAEQYQGITGEKLEEEYLVKRVVDAILRRVSPATFAQEVTAFLDRKKLEAAGQGSLFAFTAQPEGEARRVRRVVQREVVSTLLANLGYLETVRTLFESGGFGESPFAPGGVHSGEYSPGSPVRMVLRLVERLERFRPQLEQMASAARLTAGERTAAQCLPDILGDLLPTLQELAQFEEGPAAAAE